MVVLHLDNSTAKAYLHNQDDIVSFSFHIESHQQAWYYSYSSIYTYPSQCERQLYTGGSLVPEWHLLLFIAQATFQLWGQPEVDLLTSSYTNQHQHYYTLENPLPLAALRFNTFRHPWTYQESYVFPPSALVPLVMSMLLAEHVTGQFRLLSLVAPCLMEAP